MAIFTTYLKTFSFRFIISNFFPFPRFNLSTFRRIPTTLSQSFVLIQDGVEITELPWVVKKLSPSEFFFNGLLSIEASPYSEDEMRSSSDQASNFAKMLHECKSVHEVIGLLEIPGKTVTSQSASLALLRICMLKSASQEDINSFIKKAILSELCDVIKRDIKVLSNTTLLSIVRCSLGSEQFDENFMEWLSREVEERIAVSFFSISELCDLIAYLSEITKVHESLIKILWIHLGNRFHDINENNIAKVFQVLRNIIPEFQYLIKLVDKQLQTCWWKLQPQDVASISNNLSLFNFYTGRTFSSFGRWLLSNVYRVNMNQMKLIIGMYNHFNYSDTNVLSSLEKFIHAFSRRTVRLKNNNTERTLVAMAARFCIQRRILSTKILEAIATDFSHPSALVNYDLRDGLTVLRCFGILNFLPSNSSLFFSSAEIWIEKHVSRILVEDLLSLLASFIYIKRFPVNFSDRVLNTHVPSLIRDIPDPVIRNKASRNLLEIQASYLMEFPTKNFITLIQNNSLNISLTWLGNFKNLFIIDDTNKLFNVSTFNLNSEGRCYKFQKEMAGILRDLLAWDSFSQVVVPRNTPHLINFELIVDKNKKVLKESSDKKEEGRIALLLVMPEQQLVGGGVMGELALKLRHLDLLGFKTIMISYDQFSWKWRTLEEKSRKIKSLLQEHILFS